MYQNEQLCLQRTFLRKCTNCRKNWLWKKSFRAEISCKIDKKKWVLYIKLDKIREAEIQSCFNCDVEFSYPKDKQHFENLFNNLNYLLDPQSPPILILPILLIVVMEKK